MLETRSIAKAIIFSFLTLGIYSLYWFVKMTNEVHELSGNPKTASGGLALFFTIITFGLYAIYWVYRIASELEGAIDDRGMRHSSLAIICLVLLVVGLGIVSYALIQDGINDVIKHDKNAVESIASTGEIEAISESAQ